jgi:uncharacterized protein DUF2690
MPQVHLNQDFPTLGRRASPDGGPERQHLARRAMKRLLLLAAAVTMLGSPLVVSAAGGSLPSLPSLPETPQTDDPTVIAFSALHGPAMGSASCYQFPGPANCNGTNPVDVECSADAYTVYSTQTPIYDQTNGALIGYLELRYSPHCGTNWARTTFTNPAYISPLYQRDTYVSGAAGRADDTFYNDEPVRYSAEIYAPSTTECAYVKVTEGIVQIAQVTGTCA